MNVRFENINPLPRQETELTAAVRELREFGNTGPMKAAARLLRLIDAAYMQTLRTIPTSELERMQGQLAQVDVLRRLFEGDASVDGRV